MIKHCLDIQVKRLSQTIKPEMAAADQDFYMFIIHYEGLGKDEKFMSAFLILGLKIKAYFC